jgi:hemoglobin/transferrin/lactoferrin receptor protein
MQKLRFKLSADWDLTFAHHYSKTSEYGRYDRHLRTKNNQPRYAEWDYGPQFWSMSSLKLNHISTSKLYDEVNILGAFQKFEESRISRDFNDNIRNIQEETVDAYSLNIDFKKTLKGNTELYYGIETVYNKVESIASDLDISNNNSAESQSRYPNSDWIGLAGYFSFEKSVFKNTRLNTGIRFNHFYLKSDFSNNLIALPFDVAKLNNNALNVNIGLVNKLNENTKISLNIANAFRAPNVDDIGKVFDSAPGIVIVPNPTLKAEIAYNADINIEKRFNNNAKISLGGYYTYLDNAMVRRDYTLNDQDSIVYLGELSKVQAIQNAAFVKVVGLNLNCSYPLSDLFILKAKLNLQHGVEELDDKTENPARHEAPTFGELEMIYSANNFKVALSYMHNLGKSFEDLPLDEIDKPEIYAKNADGNPYSPAYGILSLKSQYTISSNFTINVGLENIADIRYKSYSSGLAGAGRNLVTSINIHF